MSDDVPGSDRRTLTPDDRRRLAPDDRRRLVPDGGTETDTGANGATFEAITEDLIERTVEPTEQALADAGSDPDDIDEVILVGGSTRIPSSRAGASGSQRVEPISTSSAPATATISPAPAEAVSRRSSPS